MAIITFNQDKPILKCNSLNGRESKLIEGTIDLPKPKVLKGAPFSSIEIGRVSLSNNCYLKLTGYSFLDEEGKTISDVNTSGSEINEQWAYETFKVPDNAAKLNVKAIFRNSSNYSVSNPGGVYLYKATLDTKKAQYYKSNPGVLIAAQDTSEYPSNCNFTLIMVNNGGGQDTSVYKEINAPKGFVIPEGEHQYTIRCDDSISMRFSVNLKQYDAQGNMLKQDRIPSPAKSLKTISYTVLPNVVKLVIEGKANTTGLYTLKWYLDFTSLKFPRGCNGWFKHRFNAEDTIPTSTLVIEANGVSDYNYRVFEDNDKHIFYPENKQDFSTKQNEYYNIYLEPTKKITQNTQINDLWVYTRQFPSEYSCIYETERKIIDTSIIDIVDKTNIQDLVSMVINNDILSPETTAITTLEDFNNANNIFNMNPKPNPSDGELVLAGVNGHTLGHYSFKYTFNDTSTMAINCKVFPDDAAGEIYIDGNKVFETKDTSDFKKYNIDLSNVPKNKEVDVEIKARPTVSGSNRGGWFKIDYISISSGKPSNINNSFIAKAVTKEDINNVYIKDLPLPASINQKIYYSLNKLDWHLVDKNNSISKITSNTDLYIKYDLSNPNKEMFSIKLPLAIHKIKGKIEPTSIKAVVDTKKVISKSVAIECDTDRFSRSSIQQKMDTLREVTNKKLVNIINDSIRKISNSLKLVASTKRPILNSSDTIHDLEKNSVLNRNIEPQLLRKITKNDVIASDTKKMANKKEILAKDTKRNVLNSVTIDYDTSRFITVDAYEYKDVTVTHSPINVSLKTTTETHKTETDIFKIVPLSDKVRSLSLKVYRRDNTVWQAGNTSNVYAKYKLYDKDKVQITDYLDVPVGELHSQYVLVDIETPKEAKYISFELYMSKPHSGKEHRIKLSILTANINNLKVSHLLTGPKVVHAYSESEPYWIHAYGPIASPLKAKACTDAQDVYMSIGNYDNMTHTNKLDYEITTSSYIYVKTSRENFEDNLVYIEETMSKIPTNIIVDTQRDITSNYSRRWISIDSDTYLVDKTNTEISGVETIEEESVMYVFAPDNMEVYPSKLELTAIRTIDKTNFTQDYSKDEYNYIRISYSFDNKVFVPLVVDKTYKTILDIPAGTRRMYFKYAAKNTSNDFMQIRIKLHRQEIFHKNLQYYSLFTKTINDTKEDIFMENSAQWERYEFNMKLYGLNTPCNLYLDMPMSDSNIRLGTVTKDGKTKSVPGKVIEFNPNELLPKVYIYVKGYNNTIKPKAVYMITLPNKDVNIAVDTLRKASGKLLSFVFDTKKSTTKNDSLVSDSTRKAITTKVIDSDTLRTTHKDSAIKTDSSRNISKDFSIISSTIRKIGVKHNLITDSKRKTTTNCKIDNDTKRNSHINYSSQADSHRNISKACKIVSDTLRKIAISKKAAYDSKRTTHKLDKTSGYTKKVVYKKDNILASTKRLICLSNIIKSNSKRVAVVSITFSPDTLRKIQIKLKNIADTKKQVIKSLSTASDTIKKSIKKHSIDTDSKRTTLKRAFFLSDTSIRIIRTARIKANTKRRVRTLTNTYIAIAAEVKRVVIKNVAIDYDTVRFLGIPYTKKADSYRRVIHDKVHEYDLRRVSHKDEEKNMDTKRMNIKPDIVKHDTQRNTYWHLYTNVAVDLKRKAIKNQAFVSDTKIPVVVKKNLIADTLRESYFKRAIELELDTNRKTTVNEAFVLDTDRMPFYFVNKVFDAKRSRVYQGKTFLFDTARDKYVVDMTKVNYDTVRAINVINPYAKVYEYNIKVWNSLTFNMKM